jgi:hypothetical protein
MNWIDPKVTPPILNQVYLVLFKPSDCSEAFVAMATVKYNRIYDEETGKYENGRMGWSSLYAPTKIRSFNIEGALVINKPYQRDVYNIYPIARVRAYISIADIDYPHELLMKSRNTHDNECECDY